MPTIEKTADLRIPVSFRLPTSLVRKVEAYAEQNRLSKTTAFEHFLQLGIESELNEEGKAEFSLAKLDEKLDKILSLIEPESEGEGAAAADEAERVKEAICSSAQKCPAIKKVYLFGAFASGTFDAQSAVDLRIKTDRAMAFSAQDGSRFAGQVEQLCGRKVNVISSKKVKDKQLAESLAKEKVLVYERGE